MSVLCCTTDCDFEARASSSWYELVQCDDGAAAAANISRALASTNTTQYNQPASQLIVVSGVLNSFVCADRVRDGELKGRLVGSICNVLRVG